MSEKTCLSRQTRPETPVFRSWVSSLWRESGFTQAVAMFYGPGDGPAVSRFWT